MKFYIFGNNTGNSTINTSAKKAAYITNDLDCAVEMYKKYVKEVRFANIYLVMDYEAKKRPLFTPESVNDDFDEMLPFFILGEWHIGEDSDSIIRGDHTEVSFGGFCHEFENNIDALRLYLSFLEKKNLKFTILYSKSKNIHGKLITREFKRIIADHDELQRRVATGKGYSPIRNVIINTPDWDFSPFKERTFYNYIIPKQEETPFVQSDNVKELKVL